MNTRIILSLFALAASVHAADWPQYHGPESNSRTPETVAKPWSDGAPKTLWKIPLEGGFSSFAAAGGKAFTIALKEIEGAKQETLLALDAATGKELWVAPLNVARYDRGGDDGAGGNRGGDGPRSTPACDDTQVYTLSSQLALRAYDAATGKVAWTRDLMKEHGGRNIQWQNAASPLLANGLLYVGGGGADESLLAINPKDGSVVWKGFNEKITHATPVAATIQDQPQIIFFLQSGLLAVEPKSGKELWRYPFRFSVSTAASPVVDRDIVFCSAGYGVGAGAVRVQKQGDKWEAKELYRVTGNKPLATHWSTPVSKDGYLYGMFQFKEYAKGPIKCVEIATGQVKWEQAGFGPGNVILAGTQLIALSDEGHLVLIDASPDGYKEVARADVLDGKCWTTPAIADGRIFARSTKEAVCIDVAGR